MTTVADNERRVTLPISARPGDQFTVESPADGQFVLTRIATGSRKARLVQKNGLLMASNGHKITMAQTRALMDEFP